MQSKGYFTNSKTEDFGEIIKEHSKSFYFASSFLPEKKKQAIWSLYAFCRSTDDLVDNNTLSSLEQVDEWKEDLNSYNPKNNILSNFKKTVEEFNIPIIYANELIDGCRRDLVQNRYATFPELSEYCYQVASTVGLMSTYIVGFNRFFAHVVTENAIKAGIALQLTNIIRDVKEDLDRNRIYLPEEDFKACNCDYNDPQSWKNSKEFKSLIKLQVTRARNYYKTSHKGIKHLDLEGRFSINCALTVYEGILSEVEKRDYDVLSERAYVSLPKKLALLPLILVKSIF